MSLSLSVLSLSGPPKKRRGGGGSGVVGGGGGGGGGGSYTTLQTGQYIGVATFLFFYFFFCIRVKIGRKID